MTNPITGALTDDNKAITGTALQESLVDLIDLSLIAKQAHWNVIGRGFRSVHLQLDVLVDLARQYTDEVAERASAIGFAPDGRAATVVKDAATKGVGEGFTRDTELVGAIVDNLAAVIARMRHNIDVTERPDPVTQDLLIEVADKLEQQHWMFQAIIA